MLSLSLKKWVRYEPPIPGNLDAPKEQRFFVEVLSGLTKVELLEVFSGIEAAHTKADGGVSATPSVKEAAALLAASLATCVRLGSVPLSLDGVAIDSTAKLFEALYSQRGFLLGAGLIDEVVRLNRVEGMREVFFGRPSGSGSTTAAPSSAKDASQTAGP